MKQQEKGYALIDTLIAAAIAAGVVITVAQGLAIAARSTNATKSLNNVVNEAEIVASRLEAGLRRDTDLLEGLSNWTVASAPYQLIDARRTNNETQLTRYVLTHQQHPAFSFERIVLTEAR